MFRSLRGSTAAKNAPPPTVYAPPAFAPKKAMGTLPPPPVRRVSTTPAAPAPEPEEVEPEPEQEEAGAWAEALYDYTSEVRTSFSSRISSYGSLTPRAIPRTAVTLKEASDLHLRAGERVLVTEQTSSDWCASLKLSTPDPKYSSSRILGGLERSTVVVDFSPCHM
jgi:hypothetical protein